jgi:hypothetical protein
VRQGRNTTHRQGGEAEPAGRSLARQRSEREPQRIVGDDGIVAIGGQKKHPQVLDPAAEVTQQIQRCLISPVDVLDGDNGESFQVADLSQQCA